MKSLTITQKGMKFIIVTKGAAVENFNYSAKTKKQADILAGHNTIAIFKIKQKNKQNDNNQSNQTHRRKR